jgi:hypothetical protein
MIRCYWTPQASSHGSRPANSHRAAPPGRAQQAGCAFLEMLLARPKQVREASSHPWQSTSATNGACRPASR